MGKSEKSYEELLAENERLQEEVYALKGGVHDLFDMISEEYPNLDAKSELDRIRLLGIIYKSLESRKYTLNKQLEALDSVDDGIAIFTEKGKLVFCNVSFPKVFKISPENLIDAHWRDLFTGKTLAPIKDFLRELNPDYPVHKEVVIPFNKHHIFLNSSIYPLKNGTFLVNVKDVTAEKEKLFTIQEQALLLRSSGEFMAVCNKKFDFNFLNEAGRKLFAISDGWSKMNFVDFIDDEKSFKGEVVPKVLQKNGWIGELMVKSLTRSFPVNCEVIPFKASPISEGGFYIVLRDITERKEAIKKLVDAKDEAENNMKIRQQFLAKMSHEIRTPMNAIIGLTNLLVDSGLTGKKSEFANSIKLSADNLLVIINDILDLSKIESGKLGIEQVRFDFYELMNGVKSIFQHKIENKGLSFSIDLDENIPQYLEGDPTRLNQILLNLLSNSEKFTQEGAINVTVKLVLKSNDKMRIQFAVEDTGKGIAKENLDKIFHAFTQESDDTTRLYGGTGLGLTIVQQLVSLQGGDIWVDSRLNKGSLFFVEIDYGVASGVTQESEVANSDIKDSKLKSARFIMAEDYPMNRLLAKSLFDKWGLNLTMVNNGKELLNDLNTNSYDVILMDIQMPEMDGLEATRTLRKRGVKTPVIAITAHAFIEEQIQCTKAGMNDFLSKPFDERELKEKLVTYLNLQPGDELGMQIDDIEEFSSSTLDYFSLDYIRELGAGDEGFIQEMLTMFVNQVPDVLNKMITHLNDGDKEAMAKYAHTVQSSFGMVERKDIKEDLKKLEMWGKGSTSLENPIGELNSILQRSELIITAICDYLGVLNNNQFIPIEVAANTEEGKTLSVDFKKINELGEGDDDFKKEMLSLFISQTSDQIIDLRKLIQAKNYKAIGLIAHNMIASFDLIGCEVLINYARIIEEACLNVTNENKMSSQIEDYLSLTQISIDSVRIEANAQGLEI